MKTKLISVTIAFAVIAFISYKSSKMSIADIALDNIEALADPGEGGIHTVRCGKDLYPSTDNAYHFKCNSSTTTNTIYSCPNVVSPGDINSFEGTFYCYR